MEAVGPSKLSARLIRRFFLVLQRCSISSPAFHAAIRQLLKQLSKRAWHCFKCHAIIAVRAGLPCTPMTATASAFPALGNPTRKPHSVSLLCTCGSLSFQRATQRAQEPVRKKTAGQRTSALGCEQAHVGSDPACLTLTTQRGSSCPLPQPD